jgi:hypothetical protein
MVYLNAEYVIKVDKVLDKYDDIYPICCKIRHDISIINNHEGGYEPDENKPNYQNFIDVNLKIDCNLTDELYLYRYDDIERNVEYEVNEDYGGLLNYHKYVKFLTNEELEKMKNTEIEYTEYGFRCTSLEPFMVQKLTKDKDKLDKIKELEKKELENIKLNDNQKELLAIIRKELELKGINIIKEGIRLMKCY